MSSWWRRSTASRLRRRGGALAAGHAGDHPHHRGRADAAAAPLREAGVALGAPLGHHHPQVLWRAAGGGILTGGLLAFARISGETAPLLFTALNNQFFSLDLTKPIANLPVVIFNFALSAYDDWRRLAWAGALLIAARGPGRQHPRPRPRARSPAAHERRPTRPKISRRCTAADSPADRSSSRPRTSTSSTARTRRCIDVNLPVRAQRASPP